MKKTLQSGKLFLMTSSQRQKIGKKCRNQENSPLKRYIAVRDSLGLKGGKGPWWSALGPPGVLRKCREMPTVS